MKIKFKKLHPDAVLPRYAHGGDAGMDVCAVEEVEIPAGGTALARTGWAAALPRRYEIQVRPRSGLALKHGVTLPNSPGTIDGNYRGEICIVLINHGREPFRVEKGMRVAQLVVGKLPRVKVEEVDTLDQTERGEKGFGSSGL